MSPSVQIIPLANLAIIAIPVIVVLVIMWKWSLATGDAVYSLGRMLAQLLLIGYLLGFIFESDSLLVLFSILAMMVFASGWIALRTSQLPRKKLYRSAIFSIVLGGGSVLFLVVWGVLDLSPWYQPHYIIPLAGMIFATIMNNLSLAIERLETEIARGVSYLEARNIAFRASMIPIVNTMFAVGLVTLPGMMTGQILSGISPLIAARYQIMVMCMVFAAAGMATALFLHLIQKQFDLKRIP